MHQSRNRYFSIAAAILAALLLFFLLPPSPAAADQLPGSAPAVTRNDVTNRVSGMATSMEYKLDGAGYADYTLTSFDSVSFAGTHELIVRYKATAEKPASLETTLTFTPNPFAPAAPGVMINDRTNRVYGMTAAMEYNLDGAGYVAYVPSVFNLINFSGSHTLLVRFKATAGSSAGAAVTLNFTTNPTTAKVVFTFDDGWLDTYTHAYPILKMAGYKGTVYVCRDITTGTNTDMMRLDDVQALYRLGWDISNHTTNHDEIGDRTDPESLATLRGMYLDNQNWILNYVGWRGAFHAAYPSGKYSTQLIAILKDLGLMTGRLAEIEANQPIPITDPNDYFLLPVQPLESENEAVTIATSAINSAISTGNTVIFMIHRVDPNPGDLVLTTADFQTIVNYVRARPTQVEVVTLSEWFVKHSVTPTTPAAPNITLNDNTNTVSGMAAGMEYNLDGTGYVAYDPDVFNALDLTGRHFLLVRQAADDPVPAGLPKVLILTADPGGAKIIFAFHNGSKGFIDNALPILAPASFHGTAYVSRDIIGTADMMTVADLTTLQTAGWAIANRPYNNSEITGLDAAAIQTLFSENQAWLTGIGLTSGSNHASYDGLYSDALYQAFGALGITTGVNIAESGEGIVDTPLTFQNDYYKLPVYNIYNGDPYYVNRAKTAIDNAVFEGDTVILSIYGVAPGAPASGIVLSSEALQEIVNYVNAYAGAGQISCVTINEWLAAQS